MAMSLTMELILVVLGLFYMVDGLNLTKERRADLDLSTSKCPQTKTVGVDLKELGGDWYLQMYSNVDAFVVECAKDNIKIGNDGMSAIVNSTYKTQKEQKFGEVLTNWDQLTKGEFIYHLQKFPIFLMRVVVAAYEKDVGLAMYTCMLESDEDSHLQVLTKERNPDTKVVDQLVEMANLAGANVKKLQKVAQDKCPQ